MKIKKILLSAMLILPISNAHANFKLEGELTGSSYISSGGGDLNFNLKVSNRFAEQKDISYFNYLIFPDGKHYNIDEPKDVTLSVGEPLELPMHTLNIPNLYPGGNYAYRFSIQDKSTGKLYFKELKFNKETDGIRLFGQGKFQTCALDAFGLECWGRGGIHMDHGQYNVPTLSEVTDVALGSGFSCALEKGINRPTCWGQRGPKIYAPRLNNPRKIVAGDGHACAIDDSDKKVVCWGYSPDGEATPPSASLNNPIQIGTSDSHTCALNRPESGSNFVKCWGSGRYTKVPSHINPSFLAVGGFASCMIDQGKVVCWGIEGYYPITSPDLVNPVSVAVRNSQACAMDDNGITCWDKYATNLIDVDEINQLSNPTQLVISYDRKCAVHDGGVKCWGEGANDPPVPARFVFPTDQE